jgi:hypothetical protein
MDKVRFDTFREVFSPFDEMSSRDRYCVGLPRRHLSLSEFLTLSAI